MNILTLTEAQTMHDYSAKSDEPEAQIVTAILEQLISHLDIADKVVQITSDGASIIALKGDGTLYRKSMSGWVAMPVPTDEHRLPSFK